LSRKCHVCERLPHHQTPIMLTSARGVARTSVWAIRPGARNRSQFSCVSGKEKICFRVLAPRHLSHSVPRVYLHTFNKLAAVTDGDGSSRTSLIPHMYHMYINTDYIYHIYHMYLKRVLGEKFPPTMTCRITTRWRQCTA